MPQITSSETVLKYPWQRAVLDAFTEMRSESLPLKVNAAEHAISERLDDPALTDLDERGALRDALNALRVLFP